MQVFEKLVCLTYKYLNTSFSYLEKFSPQVYLCTLSESESVKFSQIESVICLFTDSPEQKYISLLNQLIFTEEISGI